MGKNFNVITTAVFNFGTFKIVKDNEYYLAVNEKYIGKGGRIKQQLRHYQLFPSKTLSGCIENLEKEQKTVDAMEYYGIKYAVARYMVQFDMTLAQALQQQNIAEMMMWYIDHKKAE